MVDIFKIAIKQVPFLQRKNQEGDIFTPGETSVKRGSGMTTEQQSERDAAFEAVKKRYGREH